MKFHNLSEQEYKELSNIKNLINSNDIESVKLGLELLRDYPQNIADLWTISSFYSGVYEKMYTLKDLIERVKIYKYKDYTVEVGCRMLLNTISNILMDRKYYLYEEI